jgi:hypothetical protein
VPRQARVRLARRLFGSSLPLLALTGLLAAAAQASVGLATGATHATLQVDAKGDALVRWSQAGQKETVLVTAQGTLTHGGSLTGPDVSKPTHVGGVPAAFALRSTPGGNLWALQLIAPGAGKPVSLDLSHWHGAPTALELSTDGTHLKGAVSFGGKPVSGYSTTLAGLKPKIYVYLDCFGCGGHAWWSFMLGVAPKADGTFSALIRPNWKGSRYRATVAGPNAGTTYAPDAETIISG